MCGLLFRKLKLPEVLGFIIAGILIGPAVFGQFCGFTLIGFEGAPGEGGVADGAYKALFVLEGGVGSNEDRLCIFKDRRYPDNVLCRAGDNLNDIKNTALQVSSWQ